MSEIHFSADFDNSKFEAGIKQSNKTVGEWVQEVEKAGEKVDTALNKVTGTTTEQVKVFKTLKEEMAFVYKEMMRAIVSGDQTKADSLTTKLHELRAKVDEVGKAEKNAAEAEREFNVAHEEAINKNNEMNQSTGSLIASIQKWVLGIASVGTALKIAKGIIESTDATMQAFETVTEEVSAGVSYMYKTIASGDWSNFRKGLTNSMNSARQYVTEMSDIENRQNEQKIKNAQTLARINELREGIFDKGIENNDKVIENTKEIIRLQKEDYAIQAKIAKDKYDSTLGNAAIQNKIDKDKLENLIEEYSKNKEIIELGEKYNTLQARINAARKVQNNTGRVNEIKGEIKALGEGAEAAGKIAAKFGVIGNPLRAALTDLKAEYVKLGGISKTGSKADERQLAAAENRKRKAEEEAKKKAEEDARLENRLAKQKELLNKAIEDGSERDIRAIAKRIAALNKEIETRDLLAKRIIDASEFEGFSPTRVSTGGLSIPSVLPKAKKPSGLASSSPTWAKEMEKAIDQNDNKRIDRLNKERELRQRITGEAANLVYQLGQAAGLSEQEMSALGSTIDMFQKGLSGDKIGFITDVLANLMQLIPNEAQKFAAQIEHINMLMEQQQWLIEKAARYGGTKEALKGQIELYKQQEKALINQRVTNPKDAEKRYREVMEAHQNAIDAQTALDDFIKGGITENTLADSIAQGMMDGADKGAEYLNNVLLDAVTNVFKEQLLSSPQMKVFSDDLKTFFADQVLTPEEVEKLKQDQLNVVNANKGGWDALTQGLDLGGSKTIDKNKGLSGQITRSITEDTGSELAGLFRRFADDGRVVKDYTKIGIDRLLNIEANTFNTVVELQKANVKLDTVITNTKPAFAGEL